MPTAAALLLTGILFASPADPKPKPPPAAPASPAAESASPNSPNPKPKVSANRLSREKSPYLLQHQHNPVDWFPWGEEAFAKARAEDKPILLSIGYSTCHWCHVMERESFENQEIAKILNTHFVSIKVDREERPDIDKIYMTAVQAMTGQGGWPLNVFLAPDLKPFYGGTYFPPQGRYGRPGFPQLLLQIHEIWKTKRPDVLASAAQLHQQLSSITAQETAPGLTLDASLLQNAAAAFKRDYDPKHGGFGAAPKFPRPSQPAFLLQYGRRFNDPAAVEMVLHTCERMAAGGMHDQLGGGFARYSVDAAWLVPHFEKMLYDNAQLLNLYLDAFLVSQQPRFADVARAIVNYVLRDMTHPSGGFYSAEDADSEGKEGKFYCWTRAELSSLLTPEEFTVATRFFGVTDKGNFLDHSDPSPLPGQNVLSIAGPEPNSEDRAILASAKKKMLETRSRRVRPHLDDKVLSSWNGMMLGALARASAILQEDNYRAAAEKNLAFIQSKLWDPSTKTLYHRWRDGERDSVQLLEAYANLCAGTIDLYQATLNPAHLQFAIELADAMIQKFHDPAAGGFWQNTGRPADLILRIKEDYDGAEPSANSVAVLALLKLAAITEKAEYKPAAEKTLRLMADRMQRLPQAAPLMLLGLDFSLIEPERVVIAGDPASPAARAFILAAFSVYNPSKVILGAAGPVEPFARSLPPKDGKPTAYVCTGTSCKPPTHDPLQVAALLK